MTYIYGTSGADGRTLTRPLLAAAVRLLWGWEALPPLQYSPRGKPDFAPALGRWLSLSHSGGLALCALSDGGPVGVDIERVRPRRPSLPLHCLSPAERAVFDGSWADFYRFWTLKESRCKQTDSPLLPPHAIPVPPPVPHAVYAWEGWRAAVCCMDAAPADIVWLTLGSEEILTGDS